MTNDDRSILKDRSAAPATVLLLLLVFIIWIFSFWAGVTGELNLSLSFLICSICSYTAFTPLHEASHGNVAGKNKGAWEKIEVIVGYISAAMLFAPYPMFRLMHLRHHSYTNDPRLDPDYWVRGTNPLFVALRCASIMPHYYFQAFARPTAGVKGEYLSTAAILILFVSLIVYGGQLGHLKEVLILWPLSAMLGLTVLAFFFDWLPHHPHSKQGRYIDTRAIDIKALDLIFLFQNLHLVHHLYPRVPFHRYRKALIVLEKEIREKGGEIASYKPSSGSSTP
jgi:fatty acid desaturase